MSACTFLIYGRKGCPYTQKALTHLDKYQLPYQYQERSQMPPAHETQLTEDYNHHTVPAIFLQCKAREPYLFIGGCDEFLSFLQIFGLK
jgi:glutaredoxin